MTAPSMVPLRQFATCLDGRRVPLNSAERGEIPGDYPYWGANGVVDTLGDYLFDEELVLLGEDGAPFGDQMKDVAFFVRGRVWVNNHIHVLRPAAAVDPRYLTYALNSVDWPRYISGSTRDKLTQSDMWRVRLPFVPGGTQTAIADYLDAKIARIDALIAKKRNLVALLSHREQIGADRLTVPAALGGVADLDAPGKWRTTSLKRVARFFSDGDWIESQYITDAGIRLIQTGNVQRGLFREQGFRYISNETFHALKCTEVFPGDVLISRLAGTVGCACIAPDLSTRMVVAVDVVILRPTDTILSEFLMAYLSSSRHLALAELLARGTTMQRLSRSQVGDMQVPVPPLSVQSEVVEGVQRLREESARIQGPLLQQIGLLQEHRHALISAVVTGHAEVPGLTA